MWLVLSERAIAPLAQSEPSLSNFLLRREAGVYCKFTLLKGKVLNFK